MTEPATVPRPVRAVAKVGFLVASIFVALTAPIPFLLSGQRSPLELHVVDYLLLWSIALPSFVAFFGFYRIRTDMRDAIAGGFVISFFCILFLSVDLNIGNFGSSAGSLRQLALSNFMALVGTIVVFYFGSEAAIRVGRLYAEQRAKQPELPLQTTPTKGIFGKLTR